MLQTEIRDIFNSFIHYGTFLRAARFGSGHINDTMLVTCDQGGTRVDYVLQRINHTIFKNPELLMENVRRVTEHISRKIREGNLVGRQFTLELLEAKQGGNIVRDKNGNYFRAYVAVVNAHTYDILETEQQAFQAARAFGRFQLDLADMPGGRLGEVIPDFHNTPKRLAALEQAIAEDTCGRLKEVKPEVDFALAHREACSRLLDMQKAGLIPERITHNDTKLNNVLLEDASQEAVAVIDLDTVMPGLVHYDFGDMVRTGVSPAAEDETDLTKVQVRMPMLKALLEGFLSTAGAVLNDAEKAELPFAGILLTLETGIRFLTDYLQGDVYFKTARPNHNLDRCRNQFQLVKCLEEKLDDMRKLVR